MITSLCMYVLFTEEEPDLLRHYDIVKRPTDCIEFACDTIPIAY